LVRFDDAIKVALSTVAKRFGESPPQVTVVRDAGGTLTLVLDDDALRGGEWEVLAGQLHESLGRFSPGIRHVLLRVSDLVDARDVLESADRVPLREEKSAWLVDRLMTNQDWLRAPIWENPPLKTATAFSIKGGVGRSTALSVLAWHLARSGRSVLVIDLDLEAPGIGSMLLPEMPDYGVVDWCVEHLVGQADSQLFEDSLRAAPIADDTDGNILVMPALGRRTRDYVAKLGRAYMPMVDVQSGRMLGLADRIAAMIQEASRRLEPPDVVLLDARAGLHDIGSAAVTQLGAEIFMFARDDAQTWGAYRQLFGHLRAAKTVTWGMPEEDLRWRLKMVAAQVEPTAAALGAWVDKSYATWNVFYDSELEAEVTTFQQGDQDAPHYPFRIVHDPTVRSMDLIAEAKRPEWGFVKTAFGSFLDGATERLFGASPQGEEGVNK